MNNQLLESDRTRNLHYRRVLLSTKNLCHMNCGFVNVFSNSTLDEIATIAKNNMLNNLLEMNMIEQYEKLYNKQFHIHDVSLDEIRNTPNNEIYLCVKNDS